MTPIHLTPEAADKRAIELVEPVAHLLDGLQRMELQMHIARALQLESIDTAKRVAAYLRPLNPMLGSSGRMPLRSRRRSSGSGPEDDDQQEGLRRPAVGGVVGPVAMVEARCG